MVRVLFLIENVPFAVDTRVRREAGTLQNAGASICVISPRERGQPMHFVENGINVYGYRKPKLGDGFGAHLLEYVTSLFWHGFLSAFVLFRHGFDVVHVANPPDLLWLVAAPYKLMGKRFIYDQHDLVPELYEVRFGQRFNALSRVMLLLERASYVMADHVITTTESFSRIATGRGGRHAQDVTTVRNGPWLTVDFPSVAPDKEVRALGNTIVGYLGIMNPQDHLENFLEMARIVRINRKRTDIGFVMVGSGDSFDGLRLLRDRMGLTDAVLMTGTIPWRDVLATLAAVDICIQPDLPNVFNEKLAMNKLMEYIAMGKPSIAYDMLETRKSGGEAVVYVSEASATALSEAVIALADDAERRRSLGVLARLRIEQELSWERTVRPPASCLQPAVSQGAVREKTDP